MATENSKIQSDLDDTLINTDKTLLSSTRCEDVCDQSPVEIKKDITVIEVLEESCTSFIVEDTGVIHIKKELVSRKKASMEKKPLEQSNKNDTKADLGDMDSRKDIKKEDSILRKNESTIADVYLQLDVTDNLDTYLERERVRKLKLSKALDKDDAPNKITDENEENKNKSMSEISPEKKSSKRSKKVSKNDDSSSVNENTGENDSAKSVKTETDDTEMKKVELPKGEGNQSLKSDMLETEKKDSRFIWVSNINKTTKATTLKMHLSTYGKVQVTKIVTDGKECFGYVVFETHDDVMNCMKNAQNSLLDNCEIVLSDKIPDKKQIEKINEPSKDKEAEKKKMESKAHDRKDGKVIKSDFIKKKLEVDPLTLKIDDSKRQKRYSEERRKVEELERRRHLERLSMERREIEKKRREIEKEREREREREREIRRRERIEQEERRKLELKLEKERKKLQYERQLIEKEKLELLKYKRKLMGKEKEASRESRSEQKKRRPEDEYERKKFPRTEELSSKHESLTMSDEYWKNDSPTNIKSKPIPYDIYKKTSQEVCAPPPPILSNNYHAVSERRQSDRDRQWNERKEYENRQKCYGRKIEDNRAFGIQTDHRQTYTERSFGKEYKHKDYEAIPAQNYTWDGYSDQSYKGQNIPVIRSEPLRAMPRHQNFQPPPCGISIQEYYPGSNYRRNNDYYGRSTDRKY